MLPSLIGQLLESESDGGPDERSDDEELLQAAAVLNMAPACSPTLNCSEHAGLVLFLVGHCSRLRAVGGAGNERRGDRTTGLTN
jgi:hypothetical protein